jgi:hypothetical protein
MGRLEDLITNPLSVIKSFTRHGRGMKYGTVADTIHSMEVLTLVDHEIHTVCSDDELFKCVVGG